jgi:hypothetical protein
MNIASRYSPKRHRHLRIESEHSPGIGDRSWESDSAQSNDEIRCGLGDSSLGMVLVAKSPKGICTVLLGSRERSLVAELRSRFPHAILTPDKDEVGEAMTAVIRDGYFRSQGR